MISDDKRKIFEAYLEEQNKTREQLNELKKIKQESKNNPQEDMLFIQRTFREKEKEFLDLAAKYKLKEIPYEDLKQAFLRLKQYYLEINYVLMTYDRQIYKEILERLNNLMIDYKKQYEPRKKFKFSRRAEDFGVKQIKSEVEQKEKKPEHYQSLAIPGISNLKNETVLIQASNEPVGPYKIVNCENSTIDLQQKTEILFLKDLKNCTISCALSKSTVFVESCTNCTFQLNCHQLRIHNTVNTIFKIFVTSKAIIENCNAVIFTPYTYEYPNLKQDLKDFERENEHNYWREIQDFNWLKENQKSPHFQLKQTI